MAKQKLDFGSFMSTLAQQASPATAETLGRLQEKMQQEKQERLELRLREVFGNMERQVQELRRIRQLERQVQERIRELEKKANAIVSGEDES